MYKSLIRVFPNEHSCRPTFHTTSDLGSRVPRGAPLSQKEPLLSGSIRLLQDNVLRGPYKSNLFEGCHEVLSYLKSKYQLHIITNGFEEVQVVKMNSSNLNQYFEQVVTSEMAGVTKPDPQIFKHALALAHAKSTESIMIGDNMEVDCIAAEEEGFRSVYFNPQKVVQNKTIHSDITV